MSWIYAVAIAFILLGIGLYLWLSRTSGDGEGRGGPRRDFSAAPRVRVAPESRRRCPECGARNWPGALVCWKCGRDSRDE